MSLRAERGLSANTVSAYGRDLLQYQATIETARNERPSAVVQLHLASLRGRGLASSSIARKLASIRAYHRFLVIEGFRDDDPTAAIASPSLPQTLPKALTVDEVARILDRIGQEDLGDVRDKAILEFLYATGCRVSELTGLDVHDLDLDTSTVLLTGKGSKQRIVPVGRHAIEATSRWLRRRGEYLEVTARGALFVSSRGNRISRQAVWRIVKRRGLDAGISSDRIHPHVFRHSAATHMVEGGADLRTVQELLGHASLSTTQVYTKVSPEHLREIVVVHHPRGR